MGRTTVYNNNLTNDEKWEKVSKTNKELFSDFLEYCKSEDKSRETLRVYENGLKIFFCWNMESNDNKFYVDIKIKDIIKYQNFLLNKDLSPARIRMLKSCLSSLSGYLETICFEEYPEFRNIINKVKAPVLNKIRDKTILSFEDMKEILSILIDKGWIQQAAVVALACFSGARKSELLRFKVTDFDDSNISNGLYISAKIKTKGRGRLGKLLQKYTIKKEFEPYLKLWLKEREILNITNPLLFSNINNQPLKVSTLNYWAESISELTGKNFYFHAMRHTFTTALCKNNIPSEIIKEIIGWENLEMINTYSDIEAKDQFVDYFSDDGIKYVEKNKTF